MVDDPMAANAEAERFRAEVAATPWYHTIDLPHGVVTPGQYDLRGVVGKLPLPESLERKRCLDVGTQDGFWAFEMERRGGAVVAIDLDDPLRFDWPLPAPVLDESTTRMLADRRRAFWLAHRALGSSVDRVVLSVYDLSPDVVGTFDVAFIGTLLHHLRDPVLALMAIRRVVTGQLLICAVFSASKTVFHPMTPLVQLVSTEEPFWNYPNLAGLKRQIESAGWRIVARGGPFIERYGSGRRHPRTLLRGGVRTLPHRILQRSGLPHVWFLVEPRPAPA